MVLWELVGWSDAPEAPLLTTPEAARAVLSVAEDVLAVGRTACELHVLAAVDQPRQPVERHALLRAITGAWQASDLRVARVGPPFSLGDDPREWAWALPEVVALARRVLALVSPEAALAERAVALLPSPARVITPQPATGQLELLVSPMLAALLAPFREASR